MNAFALNLKNLAQPRGRQTRSQFWPYAATVLVGYVIASFAITIPIMVRIGQATFAQMQKNPEAMKSQAEAQAFGMQMAQQVRAEFARVAPAGIGLKVLVVALLWSAVSRRLHDTGRAAWWGLMPVVVMVIQAVLGHFAAGAPLAYAPALQLTSALFWIVFIVWIVLLSLATDVDANAFGEPPVTA